MGRGKAVNVCRVVIRAVSGAVARMQMLENISEHLAAAKTPGYKKDGHL